MPTFFFPLKPNATLQAPPMAAARHERRLLAVACTRVILIEAPSSAYRGGMLIAGNYHSQRGGDLMRFYTQQHPFYCGIDLHARTMYLCILDQAGETLLHRNMTATPEALLKAIAPYRDQIVLAAECMFTWYWLADLCAAHGIPCVLGHALSMKAIHGGKAKNDKIDAHKIAVIAQPPAWYNPLDKKGCGV